MVVPNNHVFLLKMIILGCFGGTTIEGNNHIYIYILMSEGGSTAWKVVSLVFFSGRYVTFPSGKTLSPRPVDQTNRLQVIQADAEDDDAE